MADTSTPGQWIRMAWSKHAPTTLVVADDTAAIGLRVVAEFEREADAALGEAAPDLRDALQAVADAWGGLPFMAPIGLKAQISAALRKAAGGQHG
jgi:hypothetical protein